MGVEESLRAEICELRSALGTLSTTVNQLSLALTKDTEIAKLHIIQLESTAMRRIDALDNLVTELIEKLAEPKSNFTKQDVNRFFYLLLGLGAILVVIAYLIANGGLVTNGGVQ